MNLMIINQCAQKQWHIKESLKECSKESVLQITISKHKLGENIDQSVTRSRIYNLLNLHYGATLGVLEYKQVTGAGITAP